MNIPRPDLSQVDPEIVAYIETLEARVEALADELGGLSQKQHRRREVVVEEVEPNIEDIPLELSEPPTTVNIVTISTTGLTKRTPRHFYHRQRRGGMGVFDLETPEQDPPAFLVAADETHHLVVVTNQARAFRLALKDLPEAAIHERGQSLQKWLAMRPDERVTVAFPDLGNGYVLLLSERGHIRRLRYHYFGNNLRSGTSLFSAQELGAPVAACWSKGEAEIFIATYEGKAIRFAERLIPASGCLGVRLGRDDKAISIATVDPEGGVFLMGADGKGTIRLMSGFSSNKAPGAGGKVIMKTDHLVGAVAIKDKDDIFAISRLSKIIRFQILEVPPKEGVVQGVNCMALRADEVVAITKGAVE